MAHFISRNGPVAKVLCVFVARICGRRNNCGSAAVAGPAQREGLGFHILKSLFKRAVEAVNRGEVLMEDTLDNVLNDQRVKDVYLGKQTGGVTL